MMATWRRLLTFLALLHQPTPATAFGSFSEIFGDYFGSGSFDGWTERLGLAFSDDCQESRGIAAVWAWAESWLSGRGGQQRSAHCESKEAKCAPGVAVTGLSVRSGHMRKGGNRELYDFKLRCGNSWAKEWLGLRFDVRSKGEDKVMAAGVCSEGVGLTGVQVMRGRTEGRDYYSFKLRCAKVWRDVIGLPFDALKETRSATCPHGREVGGIRVHRGFQDWGSIDTYEFQLLCLDEAEEEAAAESVLEGQGAQQQRVLLGQGSDGTAAEGAAAGTTIAELMSMGATEAWDLVNSLLADPPTAVHARFDDEQGQGSGSSKVPGRLAQSKLGQHATRAENRRANHLAAADEL